MRRPLVHVLIACIVALAMAMPAGAGTMPMPAGMAIQRHCPSCPPGISPGTDPGGMLARQCLACACAGAVATLPRLTLLAGRLFARAATVAALSARLRGTPPAPDPLPPRPIVLV